MTTDTRTSAPPGGMTIDDRLLDRLVDGELDEPRRTALLRSLDGTPDGWKRCALAFLEAQCWQQAMRTSSGQARNAVVSAARPTPWAMTLPRRMFGLAAAVLLAFGVGFFARPGATSDRGRLAHNARSNHSDTSPALAFRPEGWLTTSDEDGRPVPVPLFAAAGGAEPPALSNQSAIPEYLRRQLEREGYEVRNARKLVSVALKDGRTATVPVETVQYRFVGQRVY
ncbi:MAG TPA: hypothetical protein VFB66_13335 [Tepidisphaeraceae bacterium]|nr:hypothetical protein [Tepidisphaeraceae bacterium]